MKVSIIVVNYNTAHTIKACLDSALQQQNVPFEIIVIDNASQDESLAILKSYGQKIKLIANPENAGFGKANNIAFKQSKGDYIFLLNPDANLQNASDLANLVAFCEKNPNYGLVGPKVVKNQQITAPQLFYPGEKYLLKPLQNLPGNIAWVIGACMLIPKAIYQKVNGFDEDFFLYGEEADLCLRIRKQGFEIGFCNNITVEHIGGASEKKTAIESLWKKKQAGLHLFYQKNYCHKDVINLLKRDIYQAKKHLVLLKLKTLLLNSDKFSDKIVRYKTVLDTSQVSLNKIFKRK